MHFVKENLGAVVRNARKTRNLTQQQLADQLGMSLRTIINVENGRANLKFDSLCMLIRFLCIPGRQVFYPPDDHELSATSETSMIRLRLINQINECTDSELQLIDGICTTTLSVFRTQNSIEAAPNVKKN